MGLLSAISNAVTGLAANQENLNVLSQNISNANTANYSNEVVTQTASYIEGQGTGVSVGTVTREVNEFLNSQVQAQTSINSAATTLQSYYSQIESLLGQPGSSSTLDETLDSFFNAAQNLANSPSVSNSTAVVNTATQAANQISSLASSLYTIQAQADTSISSAVSSVNTDLTNLKSINTALERAQATGQSTAGLEDQRDAAISDISQYMDVNPTYQTGGEVTLNTTSGVTLITPTNINLLSYTPAAGAQSFINGNNVSSLVVNQTDANGNPIGQPLTLATGGQPTSVTSNLVSGSIASLLSVRDSVVPNILSQLDQLAPTIRDQVNAVSNSGTSSPPPNSYTGTRLIAGNSTSQYTGSVQIAVLNSSGNPIASPYPDETNGVQPLTLNLSTLNANGQDSVDNIIDAINSYYGTPQNKVEIGGINNAQLSLVSSTVPASGANDLQFGLNLNNISSNSADVYVTGVTVQDSSGTTIDSSPTSTIPQVAISNYQTTQGSNAVTLTTSGTNTLTNGEKIYLGAPTTATTVGGIPSSDLTGFFTVENVSGNTFQVVASSVDKTTVTADTESASGAIAYPPYTTVTSGQTVNTDNLGTITADLSGNTTSPYYTVTANIASVAPDGTTSTSTVTYQVARSQNNVAGDLVAASTANGDGTIVSPTSVQPLAVATLVDANGNPLQKNSDGEYGTQQGYLKITAGSSTETIAINDTGSAQVGLVAGNRVTAGTGQGFSQYFGLNNFFNVNSLTATGDTLRNSALNLSVASRIVSNPSLISTGTLTQNAQPTDAGAAPNFTSSVGASDNTASLKMAALANTTLTYAAAGDMPTTSTTFAQYAGQIISLASTNSTNATNSVTDSQTLLSGFTSRAQAVSGVNLDQELANTVIYQNAYTASTRVITVVSELFTELMGIIQ